MSRLVFNDGVSFETSGPLRVTRRRDGCYIVGQGMMIPVNSAAEGRELITKMMGRSDHIEVVVQNMEN
jgi:hypothetical protein